MGILKEFSKDTIIYGLGNGLKKFIGFFLLPFYTRALTPEDYGILDTLTTFSMFVTSFLNIGIDSASGFYFFKAKDQEEKGKVLFTVFILRLVTVVPSLILAYFSDKISIQLFGTDEYTWIVFISCIVFPVNLLMSEQSHVYRFTREPMRYNIITILKSLVNIGLGITLVVGLKYGVIGAQLATLTSSLVVVVFSFVSFTRKIYTYQFSFYWMKKLLKFGFPLLWAGLAAWVYQVSDRFFLLHYSELTDMGYYAIGTTFSQPIMLVNMAIQMSYGVLFFSIYHDEEDPLKPKSKKMAVDIFNLYLVVTISIASVLSIFGPEIIGLAATDKFLPGALVVPLLAFSNISGQAIQLTGVGISIAEKTWHDAWPTFVTAALNIGLNFVLIPVYGFVGAGISTVISYTCYWMMIYFVSQHFFRINYPFIRIMSYLMIVFAVSVAVPFAQLQWNLEIDFMIKIPVYLFALSVPFIIRLYSVSDIKRFYYTIKKRI